MPKTRPPEVPPRELPVRATAQFPTVFVDYSLRVAGLPGSAVFTRLGGARFFVFRASCESATLSMFSKAIYPGYDGEIRCRWLIAATSVTGPLSRCRARGQS